MKSFNFLFWGLVTIWGLIAVYLVFMARRLGQLRRDVERLERSLEDGSNDG